MLLIQYTFPVYFYAVYRCMDYYININRRISFDFNDTLLFHNYTSLWKAFKFRSPKYFIQSETISISLPISTPSPDSNILHRQLYVAYTSSPKYFTHPINNTQNISIPSFKPFPNSLSTFLISTLHVSYTRFHKLNPYSVYYYLVVAQQLKTMRFNLPPSLSPQTQTNSTGGGSGKLHAPRRLSFPGNRDIRHDDPTTWPVHRSWTSRPRNVKIVRRWSWGFQVGATSFREFTDTRERVGKIMLRNTRPPPANCDDKRGSACPLATREKEEEEEECELSRKWSVAREWPRASTRWPSLRLASAAILFCRNVTRVLR